MGEDQRRSPARSAGSEAWPVEAPMSMPANMFDWIIPQQLAACANPAGSREALEALSDQNIDVVINLHPHPDADLLGARRIREVHLPVEDFKPPTQAQLDAGVAAITQALAAEQRVAVHCAAGLGRTGTLLAAYLVVAQGISAEDAITRIRALRPGSVETPAQEAAVTEFAARHQQDGPDERVGAMVLRPIGRVESPLLEREAAPLQGDEGAPDAWLVFDPQVSPALQDLHVGSEVIVLTWLDRARRDVLAVHPRGDQTRPLTGVFSTRSPDRPNPIGLHRVTILVIDGTRVKVGSLEALNGTPVIDVKPVLNPLQER